MDYTFTEEDQKILGAALEKANDTRSYKRINIVYQRSRGYAAGEVSKMLEVSPWRISKFTKLYFTGGIDAIVKTNWAGNNRLMTPEEEAAFLHNFTEKALKGEIVTVEIMHKAYQEKVGQKTSRSGFYYLLKRHNWRRVKPRPKHEKKADAETIEASKKLSPLSVKK